jgi:long-chain fatty acid transport protein
MRTTRHLAAIISLTVLGASPALGSGLSISEHSAAATGMAGAVGAVANDPSAGFYNPAGLATQTGLGIEASFTAFIAAAAYKGIAPGTATEVQVDAPQNFYLPSGHVAYRIHDRVAAGFSLYFPFGLGAAWPDTVDVNGTETPYWGRGGMKSLTLYTMFLNPNVAVKLHDRLYIGGGPTIVKGVVTLGRPLTLTSNIADDIDMKLSGEGWAVGGNVGVLVKVLPDVLNVGATYRSKVDLTFKGDAAFTRDGSPDNVPTTLRTLALDGPAEADLPLPHVISFHIAAFPIKPLTIGFGFDFSTWSGYERLNIRFPDNPALAVSEPKDWNNTVTVRVGAEYRILPELPVRAGFIFDQGPVPAVTLGPDAPDSDRYEATVGVGYVFKGFRLDVAYQFFTTAFADTAPGAPYDGAYRMRFHIASATLGYNLDI